MIFEPQLLCSHVSAVLSKHILMLFVTRNFEIYFVQNNNLTINTNIQICAGALMSR